MSKRRKITVARGQATRNALSAVHRTNMKTVLFLVLVVLAVAAPAVSLRVGTVRGFPGNAVDVPIALTYRSNELRNVVALQADVHFDGKGISDAAPVVGTALTRHVLDSNLLSPGVRRLLVYSTQNAVITNGTLARIPFAVAPNEFRNFSLTLSNVILVRADATPISATNSGGLIGVTQVFVASDGHADGFLNVASNEVEHCYVVQATSDFSNWVNIVTNSTPGPLLVFAEADVTSYPYRFYRALLCEALAGFRVGAIAQLADGRVQFDFDGVSGKRCVIQASTDLLSWQNVRTNMGLGGSLVFTDSVTNYPRRFYRVQPVP